jgi:hypothetical protein
MRMKTFQARNKEGLVKLTLGKTAGEIALKQIKSLLSSAHKHLNWQRQVICT